MKTDVRLLVTLGVRHSFYGEEAPSLARFVVPPSTAALLAGHRALLREAGGLCCVLGEEDPDLPGHTALAGRTLLLGLAPLDAAWDRYTRPPLPAAPEGSRPTPCWTNTAAPGALDAEPLAVWPCGRRPSLAMRQHERPLAWRLTDAQGALLLQGRLLPGQDRLGPPRELPDGLLQLEERDAATDALLARRWLLVEPTLAAAAPWGLVALRLDDSMAQASVHLRVPLAAREDLLRYYVVTAGWAGSEIDSLLVEDATPGLPPEQRLGFTRLEPWQAGEDALGRLPRELLGAQAGSRVILFEAERPASRAGRSPRRLQLRSQQRVLVERLPQPGATRADAQFVVHLAPT